MFVTMLTQSRYTRKDHNRFAQGHSTDDGSHAGMCDDKPRLLEYAFELIRLDKLQRLDMLRNIGAVKSLHYNFFLQRRRYSIYYLQESVKGRLRSRSTKYHLSENISRIAEFAMCQILPLRICIIRKT